MSIDWQSYIGSLTKHTSALLRLSKDIFYKKVPYTDGDHTDLMLLGYSSRQDGHLRAIETLVKNGHDSDTTLIARTMFEGCAQLAWAMLEVPERPRLWFRYGLIEDWRQAKRNQASGMEGAAEVISTAELEISQWESDYYSNATLIRIKDGKAIPADPFRRNWLSQDFASLCQELGWTIQYDSIYRTYSDIIHWSARSLFLNVDFEEGKATGYRLTDPHSASNALKIGHFSLHKTLGLLNLRLELGLGERLEALNYQFLTDANRIVDPV